MKVKCIQTTAPRSDGRSGPPTGITEGKTYPIAEYLPRTGQYSIINDDYKLARYSADRFVVVEPGQIPPLRENFNELTSPLRSELKAIKAKLKELSQ